MENIIDIIYFIAAIAVASVFIYVMVNGFLRWTKKGTSPIITVKAAVSGKRIVKASNDLKNIKTPDEYFVTFANSHGSHGIEKELRTTESEYKALDVGISGTLVYRGDVMLSFEAAVSSSDEKEVETNEE